MPLGLGVIDEDEELNPIFKLKKSLFEVFQRRVGVALKKGLGNPPMHQLGVAAPSPWQICWRPLADGYSKIEARCVHSLKLRVILAVYPLIPQVVGF